MWCWHRDPVTVLHLVNSGYVGNIEMTRQQLAPHTRPVWKDTSIEII